MPIDELDRDARFSVIIAKREATAVVYSPQMDHEVARELGKIKTRVKALESGGPVSIGSHEHEVANPQAKSEIVPEDNSIKIRFSLGQIASILVIAGTLGAGALYVLKSELHSALDEPSKDIAKLQTDVQYLRRDVDRLPSLPDLIKELLSSAKDSSLSGKQDDADRSVSIASALAESSQKKNFQAPPEFFVDAIHTVDSLPANSTTDHFRLTLASYRSSLNKADIHDKSVTVQPLTGGAIEIPRSGLVAASPNVEIVKIPQCGMSLSSATPSFNGISFAGGIQSLGCARWHGVAFVNMHIKYSGEPVELHDVIFVNCTFEFSPGSKADTILTQIAQGQVNVG